MTLEDFYQMFTKEQRKKFYDTRPIYAGPSRDIICVWSPVKRRVLYFSESRDGTIRLSSDHTLNLEIVSVENLGKYKIIGRESIIKLFTSF